MADSALTQILGRAHSPSKAIQWACELEATSPKAGNVHPDESFDDLHYQDFIHAAKLTADVFSDAQLSVAERAFKAIEAVRQKSSNVNLGIVLLLVPLVGADESCEIVTCESWREPVGRYLVDLSKEDSKLLFRAIQVASAGGLGKVDAMDVNDNSSEHGDFVAAMKHAESRDRIAKQYADGYQDFFDSVVPLMAHTLAGTGDLLSGIATAHLKLLARHPDSLIARKCGLNVAQGVQERAAKVNLDNKYECQAFDQFLRNDGNKLNPGTTADLIAAALYTLMRTPQLGFPIP